ncbi:hypothetical protein HRbin37_01160 [bacterium HR37]|nr:hypothetical protein HRbin37_01160 [bacterium HR37]
MSIDTLFSLAALLGVGTICGFINTIAGGGSFLTLPVLIFMGLPPTVANGTNRLGIMLQNLFALREFYSKGFLPVRFAFLVAIPASFGAIAGAYVATSIGDEVFKKSLAVIMLVVTLITIINPVKSTGASVGIGANGEGKRLILICVLFFLIGIYGGYIQAGVGFLILAGMTLCGYDLIRGNGVKVFVILIFTVFALLVFILDGSINYLLGTALGIGNIMGALLGARVSIKKGSVFVRRFVICTIVLFAIKLFLD